jgi:hypothetical protein
MDLEVGGTIMWQVCSQVVTVPAKALVSVLEEHPMDRLKARSATYHWLLKNVPLCVQGEFGGVI